MTLKELEALAGEKIGPKIVFFVVGERWFRRLGPDEFEECSFGE